MSNTEASDQRQTIAAFIAKHGIAMTCERADTNPNMDSERDMDHWKCQLRHGRWRMTTYFSMGYGHNGKTPEPDDVLNSLALDSSSLDNSRSFEDWCSDYGYDTDSRRAEKTWKVCQRQAKNLRHFLGSKATYEELLYQTESL